MRFDRKVRKEEEGKVRRRKRNKKGKGDDDRVIERGGDREPKDRQSLCVGRLSGKRERRRYFFAPN